MREVGNILVARIGEISASKLARTLEQVTDNCSLSENFPIIERPSEFVNERSEKSAGSATRPVRMMSAPLCSASRSGRTPR